MHRWLKSFPSLLLLVLAGPAAAEVANQLASYTVTAERALKADCSSESFDDPRIADFERGVCLFHKKERSEEETNAAIDALRQAQVKGLPPVHQTFAALLSGVLNCQHAQVAWKQFEESAKKSTPEHRKFCRGRRISAADFGDVHWDQAYFDYETSTQPGFNLIARLAEMGSCHATVLDPAFDAECGLVSNISDVEIISFVDEAVNKVIVKYFSGVESPITAMFARKIARSEGLQKSADAAIDGLLKGATEVNAAHDAFNSAYIEERDRKIAKAYDDYRNAILRANTILDEFNRWKGGLYISEGKNLLDDIGKRLTNVNEEIERTRRGDFIKKSTALVGQVHQAINAEAETIKTTAQLCRIYFCELTNRRNLATTIRACRQPALTSNPLCIDQNESLRSGVLNVEFEGTKSVDVQKLCRNVGVEDVSTAIGMGAQASESCLAVLP